MAETIVSQTVVEVLSTSAVDLLVTQAVVETVGGIPRPFPDGTYVSHAPVEVLAQPVPPVWVTQAVVEVASTTTPPPPDGTYVTQAALELLSSPPTNVHLSQTAVELLAEPTVIAMRLSQCVVEALASLGNVVPNVIGMTLAQATMTITSAELQVGTVTGPLDGFVVLQTPVAGTRVSLNTVVDLVLALPTLPPVVIAPPTLPNPVANAPYSQQLSATGGDGGPYTFSLVSGVLPPGLSLSPAGLMTGITAGVTVLLPEVLPPGVVDTWYQAPLAIHVGSGEAGSTYTFTVRAVDGSGNNGEQAYALTVGSDWTGASYAVIDGQFPSCLTLDLMSGLISGYPMTVGTWALTVRVTSSAGSFVTRTYTFVVTS